MTGLAPLLEVRNLTISVPGPRGRRNVVENVSFRLDAGESLGIVGESGSGKTMTSLAIMGLLPAEARVDSGQVLLEGDDLVTKSSAEMERIRGAKIAMVLQDPMTALDPSFTIRSQLAEPLRKHLGLRGAQLNKEILSALERVHLPLTRERLRQYPHQLSGGMRQRAVSAIALAGRPKLLIADEPTTALDVTTQTRYLRLLRDLQSEIGVGMILIAHDLLVVKHMCSRVLVMYAHQIVEAGLTSDVFEKPRHPYTRALIAAIPTVAGTDIEPIPGQIPNPFDPLPPCHFAPRCDSVRQVCREVAPPLTPRSSTSAARCWGTDEGGWIPAEDEA